MNLLNNLEKISDLLVSDKTKKPILSLFKQSNENSTKYFLFDMAITESLKRFQFYHAYEITKDNIRKFLDFQTNNHLMPKENQMIYLVHYFDHEIQNVQKYTKDSNEIILCASLPNEVENIYGELSEESKGILTKFCKK